MLVALRITRMSAAAMNTPRMDASPPRRLHPPSTAAAVGYLDRAERPGDFDAALAAKAAQLQALDREAYVLAKRRLRGAREALIRASLPDELNA